MRLLLLRFVLLLHAFLVLVLSDQRFLMIGRLVDFALVAQTLSHQRVQFVAGAEEATEGFLYMDRNRSSSEYRFNYFKPNVLYSVYTVSWHIFRSWMKILHSAECKCADRSVCMFILYECWWKCL